VYGESTATSAAWKAGVVGHALSTSTISSVGVAGTTGLSSSGTGIGVYGYGAALSNHTGIWAKCAAPGIALYCEGALKLDSGQLATAGTATGLFRDNKPGSNSNNDWIKIIVGTTQYYIPAWT
jgi:hypothetical protein